jgi:hypothetical protein
MDKILINNASQLDTLLMSTDNISSGCQLEPMLIVLSIINIPPWPVDSSPNLLTSPPTVFYRLSAPVTPHRATLTLTMVMPPPRRDARLLKLRRHRLVTTVAPPHQASHRAPHLLFSNGLRFSFLLLFSYMILRICSMSASI